MKGKFRWLEEKPNTEKNLLELLATKQFGDATARVAEPAAELLDKVFKTNLKNCPPCKQRKTDWNL